MYNFKYTKSGNRWKLAQYASGWLLAAFFVLLLDGCKTTKNNWYYRGWHNMNARYNGYYYSRENMKETLKKLEKAKKDDYTKILPLFVYTDNKDSKTYYADFDKSIKKSSTVIQRHCITDKKKKEIPGACKWIDENYMLIGQSHFYKRDLFSALEVFQYVDKIYLKDPKAIYRAKLWEMRTDNEIGSYSLSESIIDDIRNAKDFPKTIEFQQHYALVTTDLYMKEGDYADAIRDITKAITLTKKKTERARYTFILAQLYEKLGNNKNASMYYGMVPPLHPNYDMEFAAKIKQAALFDAENGDDKEIRKTLTQLLKDDKNIEYRDQIYYAFANLDYKQKDVPLALADLTKSIKASTTNTTQKAMSYLKRGDIYFDMPDYKRAAACYDSTMLVLPKDYPDYTLIDEKRKALASLVMNLKVIELEDSLQTLARLSEKDRNKSIDQMMDRMEQEEREKEEAKKQAAANAASVVPAVTTTAGANNGAWYFYNPNTVNLGVADFNKKWGTRKLEDNWFRANKDVVLSQTTADDTDATDSTNTKGAVASTKDSKNKKDRNYYLKKVPLTPEAFAQSDIKITDAYYNAGTIYKEQILNNKKSIETLEELLKRYPENKYKLSCYYQLYRTYMAMDNQPKADYYKNIILNDYGNTEYAQIIKDPKHTKDLLASKSEVELFYIGTYSMYTAGNYSEALVNCNKAESDFAKSTYMPKFAFIKALCIGRTQDINSFESALGQFVIKYPKDPLKDKAQDILDAIKRQREAPKVAAKQISSDTSKKSVVAPVQDTAAAPKFIFREEGEYYWVIIVDNNKGDINRFKQKLSNANSESFSTLDLSINSIFLDLQHQLVSVKTFDGRQSAMNYYDFFKAKPTAFSDLISGTYQYFVISAENYTTFYRDKNVDEYKEFFTKNYQ